MFVYGYRIENIHPIKSSVREELEDKPVLAELITGYSVGAYEPEAAMFGIIISDDSALFNPIPVSNVRMVPTDDEVEKLRIAVEGLSEDARAYLLGDPMVYMFEDTDD